MEEKEVFKRLLKEEICSEQFRQKLLEFGGEKDVVKYDLLSDNDKLDAVIDLFKYLPDKEKWHALEMAVQHTLAEYFGLGCVRGLDAVESCAASFKRWLANKSLMAIDRERLEESLERCSEAVKMFKSASA